MTKVAYNTCFGGFGLSDEAFEYYLALKGLKWSKVATEWGGTNYTVEGKEYVSSRDIPRDDPSLIATIEAQGKAANGDYASLRITDVPTGSRYRIDEYDGMESVMTVDDYEWSQA